MNFVLAVVLAQTVSTVNIDANLDRHRINPDVYGVSLASTEQLRGLNVQLNRYGGNPATRYNWQQNCSNRGRDWYFESINDGPAVPGEMMDRNIGDTKAAGAEPMVTIPTIGWVAKVGPNRQNLCSFSIAKYGPQQDRDWEWFPDAGNGIRLDGSNVTGNDKNDANILTDSNFQAEWVRHMVQRWGLSTAGGVRHYVLDNEPSIWHSTHRDVRPNSPTMGEVYNYMVEYGTKIKAIDPNAIISGPEEWGWTAYFWSGYDQQYMATHGWGTFPDREANGGWDYMPWLMAKLHQVEVERGKKLVDLFTIHFYPQGSEYWNATGTEDQLLRNRSTRGLWDWNYNNESWIGEPVALIPRFKQWLDRYYPHTPLGLTEYSWGADDHINGGTTQADILGILGRENIDVATRWIVPATNTPAWYAFRMFRNYNGTNGTFGDISIRAVAPNADNVSAFASIRTSDRALTVVLINKTFSAQTTRLAIANYTPTGNGQRYQMTSAGITRLADVAAGANLTLPAQSVTTLVFPGTSDVTDPTITLASSTRSEAGTWTFTGTAADASGITRVSYHVSGTSPLDGNATGTTSWSIGPLQLQNGWNHIEITAWDGAGNPKSVRTIAVDSVMAPPPDKPAKRRAVR